MTFRALQKGLGHEAQLGPMLRDVQSARWRRHRGQPVASQGHHHAGQPAVDRARRERRDARRFDGPVERGREPLVMRPIARAMDVEERDDEARTRLVPADAARGLNVLRGGFWLAQHDHQPEAADVEAD